MPHFLHQWRYKDEVVKSMAVKPEDRSRIIKVAANAFGGKVLEFFYCFGEYDGLAITQFPSSEAAHACLMSVYGQGNLASMETTVLFTSAEGLQAMKLAHKLVHEE